MGVATGLMIGGLVASTATQLYGAKKASDASKGAARDQMRATGEAQRAIHNAWSPYVNAGQGAMRTLGRLTAAPPGARFAAPDPTQPPAKMPQPSYAAPRGMGDARPMPRTLGGMRPDMDAMPQGGGPQMVTLRAPTGEMQQVPAHLASRFEQLGAVRVQ